MPHPCRYQKRPGPGRRHQEAPGHRLSRTPGGAARRDMSGRPRPAPPPLKVPRRAPLVLRSLKGVYKAPSVGPRLGLWPSPDPGPGAGVELGGGDLGGAGELAGVGEVLAGQRRAPEDPPPAFVAMFSQQAPLGMKACRIRGWSSSQARVLLLSWLDRLPVIT